MTSLLRPAVLLVLAAGLPARTESGVRRVTLGEGTPWETPCVFRESGVPGPTVLVTGGVHGNEAASVRAAEAISHWSVTRGRLVVIPRCNARGVQAGERRLPGVAPECADLNRNFPTAGNGAARHEPATMLWEFVSRTAPDYLLDLHEGYGVRGAGSRSVGSSIIRDAHDDSKGPQQVMLEAVNAGLEEPDRRFVALAGAVTGSLARACADRLGTRAFICETTRQEQYLSLRVRQHRLMVHALLKHLGMAAHGAGIQPATGIRGATRVAIYDGPGSGFSKTAIEKLFPAGEFETALLHPLDMADGALRRFDVIVFPGGSGSRQAAGLGPEGREGVQRFVAEGGGYLGICAGAYLATAHYDWSLGVLNAGSLDTAHWRRGNGTVRIGLTREGQRLFARDADALDIEFRQGPLLGPAKNGTLPPCEVLAWYRTGVGSRGADPRTMIGTPAIARGAYGKGRVVVFSPHPEKTAGLEDFVAKAALWCARRK